MKIETIKKEIQHKIDKNYPMIESLYSHSFKIFLELERLKYEIINCLLLEFNQASIALTNHFLERLFKLALIKHYTRGVTILEPEFNKLTDEATKKYDNLNLNDSINKVYKLDLISESSKKELIRIKNEFRNTYSHANVSKIYPNKNKAIKVFSFSFDVVKKNIINKEPLEINQKNLSTDTTFINQIIQEEHSKKNALTFFSFTLSIVEEIEKNLKNKSN